MRLGCPILENRSPKTFFILCLSVSGESDIWSVRNMFCMSVSGELDIWSVRNMFCMSVSGELDM